MSDMTSSIIYGKYSWYSNFWKLEQCARDTFKAHRVSGWVILCILEFNIIDLFLYSTLTYSIPE